MKNYRRNLLLFLFAGIFGFSSFSNPPKEGMWIPLLLQKLNESDMQSMGLKLSAEDIYSINKSSLKDAILQFGGGCTGSMISDQGLLLTNHHCGYGAIAGHSTVEDDYLTDGYWAMNKESELKNPNLTAKFIVEIKDVTSSVLKGVQEGIDEAERSALITKNSKALIEKATEGSHYEAEVKPFFYGNEYYMFITETFNDVRLVGAPPSSIGKFGGDTDNWMWPRHTGDFSIFRIYADKNNNPAEYSEDNVPYKPKHFLPISMKGLEKDDFTMVFGFPGRTSEYLTSSAIKDIYSRSNPAKIDLREKRLEIMNKYMKTDDQIRLNYATKYARVANYWKKWIGENRGLKKLNAIEEKRIREDDFQKWANSSNTRKTKYGSILSEFQEIYTNLEPLANARDFLNEGAFGIESFVWAWRMTSLYEASKGEASKEELSSEIEKIKKKVPGFFKKMEPAIDREIMAVVLETVKSGIGKGFLPSIFSEIDTKFKGNYSTYADYVFANSILLSKPKLDAFLSTFKASSYKKLDKDPLFKLMQSFMGMYNTKVRNQYYLLSGDIDLLNRTYLKALREKDSDKVFYPDANSTLRLSYGKVEPYLPSDGVFYKHYSTIEGIMEKYNPDHDDFKLPSKLLKLYQRKDYGKYAVDGELRVCFTASNHTSGGNSGSPLINGYGDLVGLNFDRNWEGTMSDIMYNPDQVRNISVDIKYILFIVDKFAGATHLVEEMKLIETVSPVPTKESTVKNQKGVPPVKNSKILHDTVPPRNGKNLQDKGKNGLNLIKPSDKKPQKINFNQVGAGRDTEKK